MGFIEIIKIIKRKKEQKYLNREKIRLNKAIELLRLNNIDFFEIKRFKMRSSNIENILFWKTKEDKEKNKYWYFQFSNKKQIVWKCRIENLD